MRGGGGGGGGLKVALPWYLLSTGDNGITVDSIFVSGGYMNVVAPGVWMLYRMLLSRRLKDELASFVNFTELCLVMVNSS